MISYLSFHVVVQKLLELTFSKFKLFQLRNNRDRSLALQWVHLTIFFVCWDFTRLVHEKIMTGLLDRKFIQWAKLFKNGEKVGTPMRGP